MKTQICLQQTLMRILLSWDTGRVLDCSPAHMPAQATLTVCHLPLPQFGMLEAVAAVHY